MCTIGALLIPDNTFLLKNFDYPPAPTGWTLFQTFDDRWPHFALVDHDQQGLNSGLNAQGLGLQISRSKSLTTPTPEQHEQRTVLNAEILAGFSCVQPAVERIEAFAAEHPEMLGGNVMLADAETISVTEYFGGQVRSQVIEKKGYLVRANHSILGLLDNATQDSVRRYECMAEFLQELYAWGPVLDREAIIARCKAVLRQEPILNANTRSSFVIDIQERQVDYRVGNAPWKTFRFNASA
jgi:hypothetical protein